MVDVLAIVTAVALIVMLGPEVLSMKQWRKRLSRSLEEQDSQTPPQPPS
jgi:hypothetical protein